MAFFDQTLLLSSNQAITATAASTSIYDVTGAGSGNAPSMTFGLGITNFGADIGAGDGVTVPVAYFTVTQTFLTLTSLTIAVQAAPASSNSPGSYVTLTQTAAIPAASLVLGATILLPIPPFAPIAPGETLPRFYRFNYTVAGSNATAGTINGGILINPPTGILNTLYPNNFVSV